MDLSIHIEQFNQNQRCERDRHNIYVGVIEEQDCKQYDNTPLIKVIAQ